MKQLKLTHGKITKVDDDVLDMKLRVGDLKWHAVKSKSGVWHATCTLQLHRIIMNAPDGTIVDHGDRDGLNNLRENLKITTVYGNAANRPTKKSSKYKGVTRIKHTDPEKVRYRAYYNAGGQYVCVGHFKDEEMAAHMRDIAIKEVFGDKADLNFPDAVEAPKAVEKMEASTPVVEDVNIQPDENTGN